MLVALFLFLCLICLVGSQQDNSFKKVNFQLNLDFVDLLLYQWSAGLPANLISRFLGAELNGVLRCGNRFLSPLTLKYFFWLGTCYL